MGLGHGSFWNTKMRRKNDLSCGFAVEGACEFACVHTTSNLSLRFLKL
jgi:hypothetical protein